MTNEVKEKMVANIRSLADWAKISANNAETKAFNSSLLFTFSFSSQKRKYTVFFLKNPQSYLSSLVTVPAKLKSLVQKCPCPPIPILSP